MKVVYEVAVTVPDVPQKLSTDYDYAADTQDGETGEDLATSPQGMAAVVMAERLGADEDYGFGYQLTYDILKATPDVAALSALVQDIKDALPAGDPEDWENDACYSACYAVKEFVESVPGNEYVALRVRRSDLSPLGQLLSFEVETPADNWTEAELESLQRISNVASSALLS